MKQTQNKKTNKNVKLESGGNTGNEILWALAIILDYGKTLDFHHSNIVKLLVYFNAIYTNKLLKAKPALFWTNVYYLFLKTMVCM